MRRTSSISGSYRARQLSAGRVDVAAAGEPHGGAHALRLERGLEGGDRLAGRAAEAGLGGVVGDQVHLEGPPRLEQLGQRHRLLAAVVHAVEHQVLHEDVAAPVLVPAQAGVEHVAQRVALVHGHELGAQRVLGRVQREREPHRRALVGQALDPGQPAHRGDRRAATRWMPTSGSRSQAASTASRFISGSPMPMNTAFVTGSVRRKWSAWSRISEVREVAAEAHPAGGAERAGERAARLARQAERAAAVAVAHEHGLERARRLPCGTAPCGCRREATASCSSASVENGTSPASASRSASGRFVMSS